MRLCYTSAQVSWIEYAAEWIIVRIIMQMLILIIIQIVIIIQVIFIMMIILFFLRIVTKNCVIPDCNQALVRLRRSGAQV